MGRKVLLVEDDALIREFVSDYFKQENWDVHEAENGLQAMELFGQIAVDLVILDIMMPEMDGWSVCRRIRRQSNVPIIIITARAEDDDQIMGFELGADEYVTKPFSPKVLLARAKTLVKRAEGTLGRDGDITLYGEISVNRRSHTVQVGGVPVSLTPKEYDMLLYFMKHEGSVLSRDSILNGVWGYDYFGDLRTVDTHVKKLRAKLGSEQQWIQTIIRSGYKFEAPR
ncbi:response regulator transcription factor [Paenibacillus sp. MER 180]|uniref:response regulator transcription factor n=1 Tax=unclassified Paenibacillus TaxID=185978 RepID=UPI0008066220|nr:MULTISPECIES: response regulator transcription factor [unclassified Paenibacillus]MCM3293924.1 response regulator transcription factor [Paenibacillus sp. MER 180]OBY80527.1 DNA-binding response regulator [Paenibacillus sp. KS1]